MELNTLSIMTKGVTISYIRYTCVYMTLFGKTGLQENCVVPFFIAVHQNTFRKSSNIFKNVDGVSQCVSNAEKAFQRNSYVLGSTLQENIIIIFLVTSC